MFEFRKSLGSVTVVKHVLSFSIELPSNLYCGRRLLSQCSNISAEKRTAFLISLVERSPLSIASVHSSNRRSPNWWSKIDILEEGSFTLLLGKLLLWFMDASTYALGSGLHQQIRPAFNIGKDI
jgi:hypothetical protein